MTMLTPDVIKNRYADSARIYERGLAIYRNGAFVLKDSNLGKGIFRYTVDGSYGDYAVEVRLTPKGARYSCTCPYPGNGCKHAVAALLCTLGILERGRSAEHETRTEPYLTESEIRQQALEDRYTRAQSERFKVIPGEMYKGRHLLQSQTGRQYTVTLHDPATGRGHCTCPDYDCNGLGTCKHVLHLAAHLQRRRGFKRKLARERFPFVDIYWDSVSRHPRVFHESPAATKGELDAILDAFDREGLFKKDDILDLFPVADALKPFKAVRIAPAVINRLELALQQKQLADLARSVPQTSNGLKAKLYPYQKQGVNFALFKRSALIADEMGLGKTLQAIALAVAKKELFGFTKALVVTPASLKEQWKREIERFSHETADIIEGGPAQRLAVYAKNGSYFKITNYEAVLRDTTLLARYNPDFVILDEAQRIRNFTTKTSAAVKAIPHRHAVMLTGTPLENRLEDVYSIVQFLDPYLLSPLWRFAARHFMLDAKGKILGYRHLERLHADIKPLVIRRRKEEVLKDLPGEVVNNYYVDLNLEQQQIHAGFLQRLVPILQKKFLTPIDIRRIQEMLTCMRMVCDSTFLIDRQTHISPKLKELDGILDELVVQNGRKVVIFSEWTTMTYLIGRRLDEAGISYVELSGQVPVKKRQGLIDKFTSDRDCRVFLSTDAGGTGLNLQAADCVINFELPWNPARVRQRIGRVNRIGQKSRCINVINLIARNSIEQRIIAGLQLKTDLFKGVFDGGPGMVEFSREKRTELLNQLTGMLSKIPAQSSSELSGTEEDLEAEDPSPAKPTDSPTFDFAAEESTGASSDVPAADAEQFSRPPIGPERMEQVLNQGMAFIGGLFEMATGRRLEPPASDGRMLQLDPQTGEVTLRFKLPSL
jgi:superfamily II DNA or RNA helicase